MRSRLDSSVDLPNNLPPRAALRLLLRVGISDRIRGRMDIIGGGGQGQTAESPQSKGEQHQ